VSGVKKERQMNACYTKKNDRIDLFEKLPDEALLSAREVSQISGRSRTSLWRDVARGSLADPVKIGQHTVKWRVSDVKAFLNGSSTNGR
jgi:predicted DNA-binding transcriptional regulator AlpA